MYVCVFTLTGTSNYFRGKREDRKSKDVVQNTALSSSCRGELVPCEIISMKWMAAACTPQTMAGDQKEAASAGEAGNLLSAKG